MSPFTWRPIKGFSLGQDGRWMAWIAEKDLDSITFISTHRCHIWPPSTFPLAQLTISGPPTPTPMRLVLLKVCFMLKEFFSCCFFFFVWDQALGFLKVFYLHSDPSRTTHFCAFYLCLYITVWLSGLNCSQIEMETAVCDSEPFYSDLTLEDGSSEPLFWHIGG